MPKYLCRLEFDVEDRPDRPVENEHGELCCLVDAETMEGVPDVLGPLIERFHETHGDIERVFLRSIFEMTNAAGPAVLWSVTWAPMPDGEGYASIDGTLLIDDTKKLRVAGWRAAGADEDTDLPFIDFTEDE